MSETARRQIGLAVASEAVRVEVEYCTAAEGCPIGTSEDLLAAIRRDLRVYARSVKHDAADPFALLVVATTALRGLAEAAAGDPALCEILADRIEGLRAWLEGSS